MKEMRRIVVAVFCVCLWAGLSDAGLKEYVSKSDDSYGYHVHSTVEVGAATAHFIEMTSQTWRDITWKHWLTIIEPPEVTHPDKALLLISGGNNNGRPPSANSSEAQALMMIAQQLGSLVTVLEQVPNQPLFDGKHEDAIIALTFEKFIDGEGEEWPLLLPMVKSAVRAMDAIQALVKAERGYDVKDFMVIGASKRGWTTWLTAAVDPRVAAIAPMVIDVVNMAPQMKHQLNAFGAYSSQIDDYTERNIQGRMDTPEGQKLRAIVDPYSYRDALTLPKLIILGTNDEYWPVDAAKFYFNDLKGEKRLHYVPNAGHGLDLSIVPAIAAFYNALLTGERLPKCQWDSLSDGTLEVTWEHPDGRATLWQAHSPNRDFRKARWTGTGLTGEGKVSVKIDPPQQGWTAYYVAVSFPAKLGDTEARYPSCTLVDVVPDTFPEHAVSSE